MIPVAPLVGGVAAATSAACWPLARYGARRYQLALEGFSWFSVALSLVLGAALVPFGHVAPVLMAIVVGVLVVCAVTDACYRYIFELVLALGAVLVIGTQLALFGPAALLPMAAGAIAGMVLVAVGSYLMRRETPGGDMKLCAFIGIAFGALAAPMTFILAAFCMAVWYFFVQRKRSDRTLPLAPFMLGAVFIWSFATQ